MSLDRALAAADVRPRPFRALLRALLVMDLRGNHFSRATGVGPRDVVSPLVIVLGQFFAASLFLCAVLFARADAAFFAAAGLTLAAVLTATAVVVEFNEVALEPGDGLIVGHRPVPPRTYAAARLANLLAYVALMGGALTVFPAIVGAAQRDAGPLWLPCYALASAAVCAVTASLVLLAYTGLGAARALEPAKDVLAWTQIALLALFFFGGQLMLRQGQGGVELLAARPPEWFGWLPTWWLGAWVARAADAPGPRELAAAAGVVGVAAVAAWAALARLAAAYEGVHAAGPALARTSHPPPAVPGTLRGRLGAALGWSRDVAAGHGLAARLLARDGDLKARAWPALGLPVTALALAVLTDQCGDPYVHGGAAVVLPIAFVALLAAAVPSVVGAFRFTRDPAAALLVAASPVPRARLVLGVRRLVALRVFLPVVAAAAVGLAVHWRAPLHAALHAAVAWAAVDATARLSAARLLGDLPLSRPATRGASLGGEVALLAAAGGALGLLLATLAHVLARGA
ncbi:MAG: hypothetical protein M9894_14370 [Planctomycetes bacterium]|nr:hypothetical protein [Planctomycetota bacterium]